MLSCGAALCPQSLEAGRAPWPGSHAALALSCGCRARRDRPRLPAPDLPPVPSPVLVLPVPNPRELDRRERRGRGRETKDSVCGAGQGGRGRAVGLPDVQPEHVRAATRGVTLLNYLPTLARLALPGTSRVCVGAIEWGAEPGPSGPPRPRPAVWKHLLQSAGPGSHGPSDTLPLTPSRRREGPPPLRSSPSPAPRR